MRPRALPCALGLLGVAALVGCGEPTAAPARRAEAKRFAGVDPRRDRIGPYPRAQFVLAHDAFLAADDPRTVAAAEAKFLRDDDEVYGIVVGVRARAYAIRMLAYHHVVNDVMAGTPVAVTY